MKYTRVETGWKGEEYCRETAGLLNKSKDLDSKVDFGSFSMLWGWPIVAVLFMDALVYCVAGFIGAII